MLPIYGGMIAKLRAYFSTASLAGKKKHQLHSWELTQPLKIEFWKMRCVLETTRNPTLPQTKIAPENDSVQ